MCKHFHEQPENNQNIWNVLSLIPLCNCPPSTFFYSQSWTEICKIQYVLENAPKIQRHAAKCKLMWVQRAILPAPPNKQASLSLSNNLKIYLKCVLEWLYSCMCVYIHVGAWYTFFFFLRQKNWDVTIIPFHSHTSLTNYFKAIPLQLTRKTASLRGSPPAQPFSLQ